MNRAIVETAEMADREVKVRAPTGRFSILETAAVVQETVEVVVSTAAVTQADVMEAATN